MYQMKKCAKCGKQATHKFTRIQDGQVYDLFLCDEHAAQASPYQKPKIPLPLSDLLEGLLKQEFAQKTAGPSAPSGLRCKHCGLPFEQYKKSLMLGCSECYEAFRDFLVADLRKIHGDTRYRGRRPGGEMEQPPAGAPEPAPILKPLDVAPTGSLTKGGETLLIDSHQAIEELTQAMHDAIEEEDFAKAARCRDLIREIRAKIQKVKGLSKPSPGDAKS